MAGEPIGVEAPVPPITLPMPGVVPVPVLGVCGVVAGWVAAGVALLLLLLLLLLEPQPAAAIAADAMTTVAKLNLLLIALPFSGVHRVTNQRVAEILGPRWIVTTSAA